MQEDQPIHRQDIKPVSTPEVEEVIDPAQELLQDPELFVEKYFDQIEEEKQEGKMRYKLIEFRPKTPEIVQLIKDLQFFMFGGNGNTAREAREFPELIKDENQQEKKLQEILEQHPEQALKDTKKALLLLNSLLGQVAGVDLMNCFSHSLFGERNSQRLRKGIKDGGIEAESFTARALQNKPKELWATSQLSPYSPWTGMIFMSKSRILKNADEPTEQQGPEKYFMGPIPRSETIPAGQSRIETIRRIHKMVYEEKKTLNGGYRHQINVMAFDGSYEDHPLDNALQAEVAQLLIKESGENPLYSGQGLEGWGLKPNCDKLYQTVDAALVTGKEFFQEGRIRFIVPKHNS